MEPCMERGVTSLELFVLIQVLQSRTECTATRLRVTLIVSPQLVLKFPGIIQWSSRIVRFALPGAQQELVVICIYEELVQMEYAPPQELPISTTRVHVI